MQTLYDTIETVARDMYWNDLKDSPRDIRQAVAGGLKTKQSGGNSAAEQVLFTILEKHRDGRPARHARLPWHGPAGLQSGHRQ